jgi:predicted kinase
VRIHKQGHSVILDTAGRQPIILDRAKLIALSGGADLRVIHLMAPFETRQSRLSSREARPSQWVEDQTTAAEEMEWYSHLPPDALAISSLRPLKEFLPDVLEFLLSDGAEIQAEQPR